MRTLKIIGWAFALFGALFIAVAAAMGLYGQVARAGLTETAGRIVANEHSNGANDGGGYRAVARFTTADGRDVEIRARVRTNPPAFDVGEGVVVRYDPARPQDGVIDSFIERWFLPLIFGGLGSVFFLIGSGFLAFLAMARRRDRRLREGGLRFEADVVGVSRNPYVRFNSRQAWRVEADWSDPITGRRGRALSRNLDFDPGPWLGKRIPVFVDPDNPRRTLVDIAEIEAAAGR